MKAHLTSRSGRLRVEVEGETIKGLFEELAGAQEVLDADCECGACHSPNIRFSVRKVESFTYYELACWDCEAKLSFGQNKDMKRLWPKRLDEHKNPLPNRGWSRYIPAGQQLSPPAEKSDSAPSETIAQWQHDLAGAHTVADFNLIAPEIARVPEEHKRQIWGMLCEAAARKNVVWDRPSRSFLARA